MKWLSEKKRWAIICRWTNTPEVILVCEVLYSWNGADQVQIRTNQITEREKTPKGTVRAVMEIVKAIATSRWETRPAATNTSWWQTTSKVWLCLMCLYLQPERDWQWQLFIRIITDKQSMTRSVKRCILDLNEKQLGTPSMPQKTDLSTGLCLAEGRGQVYY